MQTHKYPATNYIAQIVLMMNDEQTLLWASSTILASFFAFPNSRCFSASESILENPSPLADPESMERKTWKSKGNKLFEEITSNKSKKVTKKSFVI